MWVHFVSPLSLCYNYDSIIHTTNVQCMHENGDAMWMRGDVIRVCENGPAKVL